MESLGERLKQSREEKNLTLDQVARDTHISRRYLQALEDEEFSAFPGETYLMGFLRNYSEYLGVDADEVTNLYKNLQIQEQPLPMDELWNKKRIPVKRILLIVLAILVVGAAITGGVIYLPGIIASLPIQASGTAAASAPAVFEMTADKTMSDLTFHSGDILKFSLGKTVYEIKVSYNGDSFLLSFGGNSWLLSKGDERYIDCDKDDKADLKITVTQVAASESVKTVSVRLDRLSGEVAAADTSEVALAPEVSATDAQRKVAPFIVYEAPAQVPIRVEVIFAGNCYFRYASDNGTTEQRYYNKGETYKGDATKEMRLWLSNAGVAKVKVNGTSVDLGKNGEVTAKLITWVRDQGLGSYRLEVLHLY